MTAQQMLDLQNWWGIKTLTGVAAAAISQAWHREKAKRTLEVDKQAMCERIAQVFEEAPDGTL